MKASPLLVLTRLFRPYFRRHVAGVVASVALLGAGTVVGLARPWPLKYLFDELTDGTASVPGVFLAGIAGAVIALALLDAAVSFARQYVLRAMGQRVAFEVRLDLYDRLQRLPLAFHHRRLSGELVNRVTRDVDRVQELVTGNLVEGVSNLLLLGGMLAVMATLDAELTLVMVAVAPLLFVANARYRHRIRRAEEQARTFEGDVASLAQETISTVRQVQAFGREDLETSRFADATGRALDANLRVARTEAAFGTSLGVLPALALAILLVRGAQRVAAGALSAGDLVVFVAYLRDFFGPTQALSKLAGRVTRAAVRAERIAEVLDTGPTIADAPGAVAAPRFAGAVRFERVTFAYPPGGPSVLDGLDFEIRPGQTAALVGATGAGKTTAAALLLRLYDPTAGRILIDGVDVRTCTLASLRGQIAVVLQDSVLLGATVAENIAYGRPAATRAEIVAAATAAGIADFVAGLPQGYDTVVGERGATLSGGQRQRLALARALVRDAPVLILDEPTTGLDVATETQVLDAVERVAAGRTTLLIAHNPATIRRADIVLVLEGGRVVERGSPPELAAAGGAYARLLELAGPDTPVRTAGSGRDAAALVEVVRERWSLPPLGPPTRLAEGRANLSVLLPTPAGRFVARRSHDRKTRAGLEFELDLLEHLRAVGYPAPEIVPAAGGARYAADDAGFVVVTRFIDGEPHRRGDLAQLRAAGAALAAYHAAVRSFPGRSGGGATPLAVGPRAGAAALGEVGAWAGPVLPAAEHDALTDNAAALASRMAVVDGWLAVAGAELDHLVVHGSFGPTALRFARGGRPGTAERVVGVFDYDRVGMAPRILDVAYALKALCRAAHGEGGWVGLDGERATALLDGYRAATGAGHEPLRPGELAALPVALQAQRLARVVSKTANTLRKHGDRPDEVEARKIGRLLARERRRLAWLEESAGGLVARA